MAGWIYDFRQELDSTIWQMPPMYHRVWQYLKYTVNHSPARIPNKDGTFTDIASGQHATSYRYLAKGVGYYEGTKWKEPNPKTIKAILDWLVIQNMITIQGNTYGTVVTVVNWSLYQSEKVKGNGKETEKKHLLDTNNKELMNDELMNNKKEVPKLYFEEQLLNQTFLEFINHRKQIKKPMSDEAIKKAVNKVKKFNCTTDEKIHSINEAIMRNWTGIFEVKLDKNERLQQEPNGLTYSNVGLTRDRGMFEK